MLKGERGRRWRAGLPGLVWLRGGEGWRPELAAGATLAAYLLPAALGDATLAGLPPEAGLYACLSGGLVFWLFCSSRHTSITVTSAISLLLGTTLGGMAGGDAGRYGALAAATALLVGAIALAAWLAKAGAAVNFISESVMTGFKAGVALHLASTQLPKLCGLPSGHGDFWERMGGFLRQAADLHPATLATGLVALGALVLGKRLWPHKPVALMVVVAAVASGIWLDYGGLGVKLLGEVPRGLPVPAWPGVSVQDLRELFPLALACFMLGAVETAAIGRMFADKHGHRIDNNQELLALAAANLAAGLGRGFPVSGGMSQSLVNESAGARTPLSGLVAAGLLLGVALFFSDLLGGLPQPVLAAIVLMAVAGLFKVRELRHLWRHHRDEFLIAVVALLGVLGAGLLKGVLVGAAISLVLLIRRAATPHVAFLGRIPGTRRYSDRGRHASNEPVPGVLAFRAEAGIVYFNAGHVFDRVLERLEASTEPVRLVVCDLSTSPLVDMAGVRMLLSLHAELKKRGIAFRLVEAHASVRDILRIEGVEEKIGAVDRRITLDEAIGDFEKGGRTGP